MGNYPTITTPTLIINCSESVKVIIQYNKYTEISPFIPTYNGEGYRHYTGGTREELAGVRTGRSSNILFRQPSISRADKGDREQEGRRRRREAPTLSTRPVKRKYLLNNPQYQYLISISIFESYRIVGYFVYNSFWINIIIINATLVAFIAIFAMSPFYFLPEQLDQVRLS